MSRHRSFVLVAFMACLHGAGAPAGAELVPVGGELVLMELASGGGETDVCAKPDGSFVVVRNLGTNAIRLYGQAVARDGSLLGKAFEVSTYLRSKATNPDIACSSDGSFMVAWTEIVPFTVEPNEEDEDVFARGFGANNAALGDAFRVNAWTTGDQDEPAVCATSSGDYIVVWHNRSLDEINSRRVSKVGPAGGEGLLTESSRSFVPPDVACASDGRALAVWGDFPSTAAQDEVIGRMIEPNGRSTKPEFVVNSDSRGDQAYPVVCNSSGSGFVVAWGNGGSSAGGPTVEARHVAPDGTPLGNDFTVSPEDRRQGRILCGPDRRFVVTTHADDGRNEALFVREVDSTGVPIGPEKQIDSGGTNLGRAAPPLAGNALGRFLVVWGDHRSSTSYSIRGRLVEPLGGVPTTTTSTTTLPEEPGVCGNADPTGETPVGIADALETLRAALGVVPCELCRCDVNDSGDITVFDALQILVFVVSANVELNCPACD